MESIVQVYIKILSLSSKLLIYIFYTWIIYISRESLIQILPQLKMQTFISDSLM